MALVNVTTTIFQKMNLINPVVGITSIQTRDMSWGNVNKGLPRPRQRPNRHWDPRHVGLRQDFLLVLD